MNTGKLKTFAQQARRILISGVEQRMLYWGFDEKGDISEEPKAIAGGIIHRGIIIDDPEALHKWRSLKKAVVNNGFKHIVEEAAYTWFNRIMAIKILSKNGFEPPQVDYGDDGVEIPEILRKARAGHYSYLDNNSAERLKQILNDYDQEYQTFAILLENYCHNNSLLLRVFGLLNDFTGLLIPSNILDENGFIHFVNNTDSITEEDYKKVELIGWIYQFYISEKKDEVFKKFKKNLKAEAEDIPAATQIFTPNWIVKYMVQNTIGHIWLDHKPESKLREKMKYLVQSDQQETSNNQLISEIAQLKLLDPACGSGHILVEGFDLLYDMYLEEFYSPPEAVESILKNNLFGLDIDLRAVQLSRFAVLIKAATKNPDILKGDILPEIYAMPEADPFDRQEIIDFLGKDGKEHAQKLESALHLMQKSQNLGSVMVFDLPEGLTEFVYQRFEHLKSKSFKTTTEQALFIKIQPFIKVLYLLIQKYEAVAANPPYMGSGNMNIDLKDYIEQNYNDSKSDLMTVFMEVISKQTIVSGRFSLINLPSWLFLSSFEKVRKIIISNFYIESMLHMGRGIFGIDFGSVAFSIKKETCHNRFGSYFRLHERNFQHIYFSDIEKLFLYSKRNPAYLYDFNLYRDCEGVNEIPSQGSIIGQKIYYPNISQSDFSKIPGIPIAYWVSEKEKNLYKSGSLLRKFAFPRKGIDTGENDYFLRFWFEVDLNSTSILNGTKWIPYNKGGSFRKWYGNREYLLNWADNGSEIKSRMHWKTKKPTLRNASYWYKEGFTWSTVSSGGLSIRYTPEGCMFDNGGCTLFAPSNLLYFGGLLNSCISKRYLEFLSPTLNFQPGDIARILIIPPKHVSKIEPLVQKCIEISRLDWDSNDQSWDFKFCSLVSSNLSLRYAYEDWYKNKKEAFFQIHHLEETLNIFFIEIYNLQLEVSPNVPLNKITILQDEIDFDQLEILEPEFRQKGKDSIELPIKKDVVIIQFISYAIGCVMGRYRLDKPGLHIAHSCPNPEEIKPYRLSNHEIKIQDSFFEIDEDGLIPFIGRDSVFSDDAFVRIKNFIEIVWGHETLTDNINFVEECLSKDLEHYLVKDFWNDHIRRYNKRPIYWLFSSKNGAFQVIAYMHRMNKFTVEKVRNNYLLKHIQYLRGQINLLEPRQADLSKQEVKKLDRFRLSLRECEEYDLLLKDVADRQIEFDLDDGVKVNYAKFGKVLAEIK